jgi:hypothetical protein
LVIVSLISEENRYFTGIPLDERRRDLRVVFSGRRHVNIKDGIRSRVHEQCDFQLLNRQLRSLCVVFRGVTTVKAGGINPNDTIGREKCNREVEQNAPNCHIQPIERLTQCRRRGEFLKSESVANPRHLDEFVKKHPVRRILPNLETEEDDVLMKCVPPFREFRGVTSDSSLSQVHRLLNETE